MLPRAKIYLDVSARSTLKLCTEQPVFHVYARSIKVCTEQPFLDVYARSILKLCTEQPVFYVHARSIKVCTEQPFLDVYARSILKLCTEQPVFHVHARSIKLCTEQPLLDVHARRIKVCTEQPVFHVHVRSIKVCTEQPFLDVYARSILKYARSNQSFTYMLRTLLEYAWGHDCWAHKLGDGAAIIGYNIGLSPLPPPQYFNTDRSKAVLLLCFLTVTCSCCPYFYFGSPIMLVTYFSKMTTCLGKSCSFGLPRVPFVNCCQFMYLVNSLLVLRAGCGI